MLEQKDIAVLKKRMEFETHNITLWRAVLVGNDSEIQGSYGGRYLMNLEEGVIFKHMKILKEIMNAKRVNDKLIDMQIKEGNIELITAMRNILMDPKDSDAIIDLVLAKITEEYIHAGKYMLLLYMDTYDIPETAADGRELEDGAGVYKSLIFSICPVTLDKEGLSILPVEGGTDIQEKIRQWVIGPPKIGFVYPTFRNMQPDYKSMMYYSAKPDNVNHEFAEEVLMCQPKQTATEMRQAFERSVRTIDDENSEIYLERLNELLYSYADTRKILIPRDLYEFLHQCGAGEEESQLIRNRYEYEFERYGFPEIRFICNEKMIERLDDRRRRENIRKVITMGAAKLREHGENEIAEEMRAEVNRIG